MRVCRIDRWLSSSVCWNRIRLIACLNLIYVVVNIVIKKYSWFLPFIAFIAGYELLNYTTHVKEIKAPALVGLPITQAVKILSDHNLNPRILVEKEEKDILPGTILSQTPCSGQSVKVNQSIFLVVAQKPKPLVVPDLHQKTEKEIQTIATKHNIRTKSYYIPSHYPQGTCFAQSPKCGSLVDDRKMTVYISAAQQKMVLFPQFKRMPVNEAKEFLQGYPVTIKVFHKQPVPPDHRCDNCIVTEQKPLANSLITLSNNVYVQLQVE